MKLPRKPAAPKSLPWGRLAGSVSCITVRRYIIPFAVGFVSASLLFVFVVLPPYGRAKVEFGRKNGEIFTKLQLRGGRFGGRRTSWGAQNQQRHGSWVLKLQPKSTYLPGEQNPKL